MSTTTPIPARPLADDFGDETVHAPEILARFARLVSPPMRPKLTQTIVLALASGCCAVSP